MADKFEDLRNYVAVVDSGGINAAAAALGIAKSAVSRRLSELEQRLGTTLINRSTRRFEPTAVGRHYYESAKRLLDELDALDAGFAQETASPPVKLTVAVDRSLTVAATAALASSVRSNPGVILRIVDAASVGEDADLWLGTSPSNPAGFQRLIAGSSTLVVVGSPDLFADAERPVTTADLRTLNGVGISSRAGAGWAFSDEGDRPPRIVMTAPDDASAAAFAFAGAGLARLPLRLVASRIASGDLERLLISSERSSDIEMWIRSDAGFDVRRMADTLATTVGVAAGADWLPSQIEPVPRHSG